MTTNAPAVSRVAIAGFGPVGAACALALSDRVKQDRITILDGRPAGAAGHDLRMIAISEGTRVLLERLLAWDGQHASPITEIHVSERRHFGRTLISAGDYGLPALGYVIAYRHLAAMLEARVKALGIEVRKARVADLSTEPERLVLHLSDGNSLDAAYLIHAEGGTFQQQDKKAFSKSYQQVAVSALVTSSAPLAGRAFERFTTDGPIALLPSHDQGESCYALVWCGKPLDAGRRITLPEHEFLAELGQEFGHRVGRFTSVRSRASFPLGLTLMRDWPNLRELGIGNAAQTLHPVAGQGFNLGLRDALSLSEVLSARFNEPALVKKHFNAARRIDRSATVGMTDFLPRVVGIAAPFAGTLRASALFALDILAPLRHPLARQMMNGQR
jgi:2-octaprenyl-6-methoxyphenol hydroxylase